MSKKVVGALLGGALLVAGAVVLRNRHLKNETVEEAPVIQSNKKARDLYGRSAPAPEKISADSKIPPQCKDFWEYLSNLNLAQLQTLLSTSSVRWDKECLKFSSPNLNQNKNVNQACFENFTEKDCVYALSLYRAEVIALQNAGESDLSKLDSSVLMNMIMAKFASGNLSLKDLNVVKDASQELLKKEPGLYAAEKSFAGALFLQTLVDEHASKDVTDEMREALERCRKSNPNDTEIWELSIVPELMKGNFEAAKELANEVEKNKPESGLPNYYRAAVFWKQLNKPSALSELEAAVQKEPANSRFSETLNKARAQNPGDPGAFSILFNVSFDGI